MSWKNKVKRALLLMIMFGTAICAGQDKKTLDVIVKENKGKVVVFDFWASWCAPCREELPDMHKLLKRFKKDVEFVFISLDIDREKWISALKEEGLADNKYNLMTSDMQSTPLSKSLKINAIPRYVIFDKQGNLVNDNAPVPSEGKKLRIEIAKYTDK
jgi:thiol-disulfide isomerase/thioredoxin